MALPLNYKIIPYGVQRKEQLVPIALGPLQLQNFLCKSFPSWPVDSTKVKIPLELPLYVDDQLFQDNLVACPNQCCCEMMLCTAWGPRFFIHSLSSLGFPLFSEIQGKPRDRPK